MIQKKREREREREGESKTIYEGLTRRAGRPDFSNRAPRPAHISKYLLYYEIYDHMNYLILSDLDLN